jgi:3-hydroxyisobutyrate dehydrogenase-like beta-hydroxyacid dehydrogenase
MTRLPQAKGIGLLHPGQMGAAIGAQAVRSGQRVLWCSSGRSAATKRRAAAAALEAVPTLADMLKRSEVVLSICPPLVAEAVGGQVAECGFTGIFVDANAISPQRAERIRELVEPAARFVDAAVIGPPPGEDTEARLYLAGDAVDVEVVAEQFAHSAVHAVALGDTFGAASALKMAFASYQKATRTLAAVALALGRRHGVDDHLLTEARRMAGLPLAEPGYLPSVAARAWRWEPEMHEVSDTLTVAGLPADLARATADVLERWRPYRDRWDVALLDVLDRLDAPLSVAGGEK